MKFCGKIVNPIFYGLSLFLILFYLFIFSLSFDLNVTEEYRCFYIDKVCDNMYPLNTFLYEYGNSLNTNTVGLEDCAYFSKGWNVEAQGVWSVEDQAYIVMETEKTSKDLELCINGVSSKNNRNIKVYFDGRYVNTICVNSGNVQWYTINIDNNIVDKERDSHIIKFEFEQPVSEFSNVDGRKLGIFIVEMNLKLN